MNIWKIVACLPLVVGSSLAQAAPTLADVQPILAKNMCLACHAVDKKLVGPAYQDVATKYKDDSNAATLLATHIKNGSKDIWGPIPMPPNPGISADDTTLVVEWILSGSPE
ncbi:cytochrome C [Alcaligenaceae bacterium]|nr:cytochrome C [Alcaligenaceae bacterium]